MGGKKKTKWRKLPLEEFTKDIPTKTEKKSSEDAYQADLPVEENNYIPSYSESTETGENYAEPPEYMDSLWYPTSCVVYNPAEVGLYSNYMMPLDNCYYYYAMPEMPQMPEYIPMPYQEYTSQLPKDTVYLLLPTQTLRPSQAVQSVVPEWQSRRRRRRYEGYADYAIIPEKQSSDKAEDKEHGKKTVQHVNSRRNSTQSNNFRRMTSFSEANNFSDYKSVSEQNQTSSKSHEVKESPMSSEHMNSEMGPSSVNKVIDSAEYNKKIKKNLEVCGIHTKATTEKTEPQTVSENISPNLLSLEGELYPQADENKIDAETEQGTISSEKVNVSNTSKSYTSDNNVRKTSLSTENKNKYIERSDKIDISLPTKEIFGPLPPLQNIDQEINTTNKSTPLKTEENILQKFAEDIALLSISTEDIPDTNSKSPLPDILSTLSKSAENEKIREPDLPGSQLSDNADLDKGRFPKSKSLLSQTSYLPNLLSSEALHNEMELELKQLKSLHSLQANQSIYKLAYDENVTDQSEADSRSPSPVDPGSQVPSSLTSAEILIHEADSGSDAGSEDVELLPHRYESETFLNENKHVYVNKLSLAVELLRTQESLPYDDEFKRVVGENNLANNVLPGVHTGGRVNLGFVEGSCSPNAFSITNHFENKSASTSTNMNEIVSQCQLKHSANSSSDSAIFSDIGFDNFEDELCETAKEAVAQGNEIQDNTEEIRVGYRRFGIQARHYFSPRAALSLNPCFCCIIM